MQQSNLKINKSNKTLPYGVFVASSVKYLKYLYIFGGEIKNENEKTNQLL